MIASIRKVLPGCVSKNGKAKNFEISFEKKMREPYFIVVLPMNRSNNYYFYNHANKNENNITRPGYPGFFYVWV